MNSFNYLNSFNKQFYFSVSGNLWNTSPGECVTTSHFKTAEKTTKVS